MELSINVAAAFRPMEHVRVDRSPAIRKPQDRTDAPAQPKTPAHDDKKISAAVERLNKALQAFDRDLAISIHDNGKIVVRVTDPKTGDVIRQIPPERILEVEESLNKIVGLFVNDHA